MDAQSPCRALRADLEDARRGRRDFAGVWPVAVSRVLADLADDDERAVWSAVLEDTADSWEAAYARGPAPPVELALALLGQDPDRCEPIGVPVDLAGFCAHCGAPIGQGKRSTARYCSRLCQRAAHGRRITAAV